MKEFFRFDSPFMRALSRAGSALILSFLWVLCSLPLLTLGASTTAYFRMMFNLREEKPCGIKDFFRAFCKNVKDGTLVWLLLILILETAFLIRFAATLFVLQEYLRYFLFGLFIALLLVWLFMVQYAFAITAYYKSTPFQALRNSFLLSMEDPLGSFLGAGLLILPLLCYLIFPNSVLNGLLLWVTVYPAAVGYLLSGRIYKKFLKMRDQ